MDLKLRSLLAFAFVGAHVAMCGVAHASDHTIDFRTPGWLNGNGVRVTGSSLIEINPYEGLGVFGGNSLYWVDSGESITFNFDSSPVSNVILAFKDHGGGNTAMAMLEGFGNQGISLGAINIDLRFIDTLAVSSRFGLQPMNSFTLTAARSNEYIGQATYFEPAVLSYSDIAPVPETETYTMMLAGLGLMGFAARSRKTSRELDHNCMVPR